MKVQNIKREKMCRKFGQKMFLRPERCASPKCAHTRRQSPPGAHGGKRRRPRRNSAFGEQLLEKQRARVVYGLSEKAFKRTVRDAMERTATSKTAQNALDLIAQQLELRLDNVVYRSGLASSRTVARQLVSHGHFLINDRKATTPSIALRSEDIIRIRPESTGRGPFQELSERLKRQKFPVWLKVDTDVVSVTVVGAPKRDEAIAVDLAKVLEFYAR